MSNTSSVAVTGSVSTVTITSGSVTSVSTSTITTSSVISTSIPPSTTTVPASTTTPSTSSVAVITSTILQSQTSGGVTQPPLVVTVTSTLPAPTTTGPTFTPSSSSASSASSATSSPSALSASGSAKKGSGGLGTSGTIAVAVIIPIVAIAALILFGLWFWRRRKARKIAEEERKNEMAEYGFNPNNDPTLVPAAVAYAGDGSDAPEENNGYRGWGATSSNRKPSTTLGSNNRPIGLTVSDNGSQPGGYYQSSPNTTGQASDAYSGDPLMHSHPEGNDGIGTLGGVAATGAAGAGLTRHRSGHNADIKRGPSNASSAYSNGKALSEASSERPELPANYYQEEVPYNIYNDAQPGHGPYGDGSYGGSGQPVIRDVQARRNTRIERAPTMPQTQGGIAQNF